VGRHALVALLDNNAVALDAEVGLVQAKLPACERLSLLQISSDMLNVRRDQSKPIS
jgi:hypothetical protein